MRRLRVWRIVLGVLGIGWGAQRTTVVHGSATDDSRRVARAALLIARAIAPDPEPAAMNRIRLLPSAEVLDAAAASAALARMSKPVECEGRARDGILELRCSRLSHENAGVLRTRRSVFEATGGLLTPSERQAVLRAPNRPILLVGIDETLELTVEEYERLEREYAFLNDYLVAGGTPESYGYTHTGAVVARFYRASAITTVERRRP